MDLSRSARSKEELLKVFRTEEILQAARRVISRDGLADASVERIAAEAGVAKGTLYLYFDSKETLLARACEPVVAELLRRTRRAIQRTRGLRRKLGEAVRVGLEHANEHQDFFHALRHDTAFGSRPEADPVRDKVRAYLRLITGLIHRGVRAGSFRPVDSRWAARCLIEVMRVTTLDDVRSKPRDPEAVADEIVDLFTHGIGTGERR